MSDNLFKLIVRFSNGEQFNYVTRDPYPASGISADTRYAVISSYSYHNAEECLDVMLVNLSDVAFIKTEKISLEDLASERRTAGLRSTAGANQDDKLPKAISTLKFI
ncbi:MAG: hypothetical protein AB1757_30645 [Acidobacteriota bacterium]